LRLAVDGTEALELVEQWLPKFVILDVHMPTISGYDVARRLRARFTPAVMQLVMMSGTDLDETALAGAKRAGFDHCIDKTSAPMPWPTCSVTTRQGRWLQPPRAKSRRPQASVKLAGTSDFRWHDLRRREHRWLLKRKTVFV